VQDRNGKEIPVAGNIKADFAAALYAAVMAHRPKRVVEIGMAAGISTLSILTALRELNEGGQLISIDPGQNTYYGGIGAANIERAGVETQHVLMEEFDYVALPQLLASKQKIQFAYIDGWHTFDYTLLDFFYLDKMLEVNGIVGFNDCGYRAVNRVLNFVRTHRKYQEIDVGLSADYSSKRNPAIALARRALRFSHADRYFKKTSSEEPDWNFYARF
jgi:predicted O-methyltransferase YrrM